MKKLVLPAGFVIAGALWFFYQYERPMYGNDEASIIEQVRQQEHIPGAEIELLGMRDIEDQRIAAMLVNSESWIVKYHQNAKGNYVWNSTERQEAQALAHFYVPIVNDGETALYMTLIMNDTNEVAKVDFTVNDSVHQIDLPVYEKAVKWFEVPKSADGQYSYDFTYKDAQGNEI